MKKKVIYPSKKTLNLCMKEKRNLHLGRNFILLLLILALAAAFSKYAVIDRLEKADAIKAQVAELKTQKADLQEAVSAFDELKEEYRRYSIGWMETDEKLLIYRSEILELLESMLLPHSTVNSVSIAKNTLSVQLADITLDDTSRLVEALYAREDVENVAVYTASTKAEEDAEALISMVITMTQSKGGTTK